MYFTSQLLKRGSVLYYSMYFWGFQGISLANGSDDTSVSAVARSAPVVNRVTGG